MSGGMQAGGVSKELLTTKGDTHGYSTVNERVGIGANTQVLTADSTEALGLKWATPTDVQPPTTTKGDLSGFSTSQARIPVSVTNGQVLTTDSTEALGLKWAAAAGGGKLELIEDFTETGATGTTKTFTVTEDPDNSSCLVLDYSIGASGSFDLLLQINGNVGAGQYEINGTSIDGGTETLINASSTSFEVCPSEILTADSSTGCGRIIFYTPEAGTTRPSILATASGQNTARYYSIAGCMFVATSSITSIVVSASTSSWKQNSNMTLYRCAK